MALRTIMRSDNVSYQWLAPAGTRRGLVDNVSAIGYINGASGEFVSIGVTQGLRDTLYNNKINPITKLPGTGITVFGQKTLASDGTSLDRINVARLINYIRKNLDVAVRPFLFEPNDPITRAQVIAVSNSLLNDLVAKRGITDYLVVCDTTNNTPFTINRNELYVDIAIQPTKAVEFIYIPIRLKNAGEIQSGNLAQANAVGTGA
jgi:phage tail sheath protein FI